MSNDHKLFDISALNLIKLNQQVDNLMAILGSNFETKEIPQPVSMAGWKQVAIQESSQPLILLNNLDPKIHVSPEYFHQQITGASANMYLRQEATERLIQAANLLPVGQRLVVFDAYRPLTVQESLFNTFKGQLKNQYPEKCDNELDLLTQQYVSTPSADSTKPSPHATGGAIDLSIVTADGRLLDMGTDFDSFDITAQTGYFRDDPQMSDVHANRSLLYTVMNNSGFTNYPEEWWHFDFGNQFWGWLTDQNAQYGLARVDSDDQMTSGIETDAVAVYCRLRADGELDRSVRFNVAGPENAIQAFVPELLNLHHPHFGIKQQLAAILARRHQVTRFAF